MMQPATMTDGDAHHARARLVDALERLSPCETASEPTLLADLPAVPDRGALRWLLASIGAVRVGDGWCFGDGPPPRWSWFEWRECADDPVKYALASASSKRHEERPLAIVEPGRGWQVQRRDGSPIESLVSSKVGLADGQRAAIRVCRLWGLFL